MRKAKKTIRCWRCKGTGKIDIEKLVDDCIAAVDQLEEDGLLEFFVYDNPNLINRLRKVLA